MSRKRYNGGVTANAYFTKEEEWIYKLAKKHRDSFGKRVSISRMMKLGLLWFLSGTSERAQEEFNTQYESI